MIGDHTGPDDSFVHSLATFAAPRGVRGSRGSSTPVKDGAAAELATLVYTSGTTGPPKGTMITHANIMATMRSLTSLIELRPDDRFLSFLPLSHITERSVSHFGQIAAGAETWFARSFATVAEDLRELPPDLVLRRAQGVGEVPPGHPRARQQAATASPGHLAERYLAVARPGCRRRGRVPARRAPRSTPSWAGKSAASSASTGPACWPAGLRRSTPTSCAGSMASGCPSPRATA